MSTHQSDRFECVEVVGEKVGRDAESLAQFARGPVTEPEVVDDRQSCRFGQCRVDGSLPGEVLIGAPVAHEIQSIIVE